MAISAPIPFDAPVTTATFPFSFPFFIYVPFIFLEGIKNVHEHTAEAQVIHGSENYDPGRRRVTALIRLRSGIHLKREDRAILRGATRKSRTWDIYRWVQSTQGVP